MNFSSGVFQRAYIAATTYFGKSTLPFGTGVIAEASETRAKEASTLQAGLTARYQWYHITIPPLDSFFIREKPLGEQPFPVLHSLMSEKSLSLVFHDETAMFSWQMASYLKGKTEEEQTLITTTETYSFFHEKRKTLLSVTSGEAFIEMLLERDTEKDPAVIASFFTYLGIPGIQFMNAGNSRFLIFDAKKNSTITAIQRGQIQS